jgi:hypothetical protein
MLCPAASTAADDEHHEHHEHVGKFTQFERFQRIGLGFRIRIGLRFRLWLEWSRHDLERSTATDLGPRGVAAAVQSPHYDLGLLGHLNRRVKKQHHHH